jgi:hypothetical protein
MKGIEPLVSLDALWGGTPRSVLAGNEVNVCMWNSTPLLGGSVHQTFTLTSFPCGKARGVS